MSDRVAGLLQRVPAAVPAEARPMVAAALADVQASTAAALALYVQGDGAAAAVLVSRHAGGLTVLAAFGAAAEAITAAVGDDPTRGYAALVTLQERAAEYAAAHQELIARPAEGNAG